MNLEANNILDNNAINLYEAIFFKPRIIILNLSNNKLTDKNENFKGYLGAIKITDNNKPKIIFIIS